MNLEKLVPYYNGKTVLVTGASSGIGRATAEMLAKAGANVVIVARNQNELQKTIDTMEKTRRGPEQKFRSYSIDLRDSKALVDGVEQITKEQPIDLLVNNAGVYYTNYFQNQTLEQVESMVLTNIMAPLVLTRALIPHFLKRGSGQVVNVSSLAAKLNFTGYGVYGGTKAGLSHSSKGLQFEFAPKGIYFSDFFAPDSLTRGYQEELKNMPMETKKINGTVKPMEASDVAYSMLVGVSKRKLEIVPGLKSRAISFLSKHLPTSLIQGILRMLSK